MENKQSPYKKKLKYIDEEKLIREVDYDYITEGSTLSPKKQFILDLEILHKNPSHRRASQRVLVSIKPRAPAIKTLYIAEKNRFHSKENSEKSGSLLAIGDHSPFVTYFSEHDSNIINSTYCDSEERYIKRGLESYKTENYLSTVSPQTPTLVTKCSKCDTTPQKSNVYNAKKRFLEKCNVYTQPQSTMNPPRSANIANQKSKQKVDIATLIVTNTSEDSLQPSGSVINKLNKRIEYIERKLMRQEMIFRSIDPNVPLSSSDEERKHKMRATSGTGRPGCSYIGQYSHIPETSAFQRYAHQTSSLSPSKATTIEKEHNSEQYGRDFTTYDGITARGRRQSASVPCKRDNVPKMAAERIHKIRHKLNPVRDYRLMDTVHYLAQGEFAPRDDGIKLTPSREAVLSDIIWEDVCRTHWPNTRLGRRGPHSERYSTRCELQRLIDSMLRERVAHVERRRRRHYRIVKLNHRHENGRPVGKTGDIIVASHKGRELDESRDMIFSDHNTNALSERQWLEKNSCRNHRSHERIIFPELHQKRQFLQDDCMPGPSYVTSRSPTTQEPTCCYHTSNTSKPVINSGTTQKTMKNNIVQDLTSGSSASTCKHRVKNPRLIVKKELSRRRYHTKEEPNLEHYILLPTLVVRTPSNMKRQKKFNELYHRILNVQLKNVQDDCEVASEAVQRHSVQNVDKKDVGFNINITLSDSVSEINRK